MHSFLTFVPSYIPHSNAPTPTPSQKTHRFLNKRRWIIPPGGLPKRLRAIAATGELRPAGGMHRWLFRSSPTKSLLHPNTPPPPVKNLTGFLSNDGGSFHPVAFRNGCGATAATGGLRPTGGTCIAGCCHADGFTGTGVNDSCCCCCCGWENGLACDG